ncbi:hypothetical protein ACVIKO_003119 [Rhizobium ruizarguesonis]
MSLRQTICAAAMSAAFSAVLPLSASMAENARRRAGLRLLPTTPGN